MLKKSEIEIMKENAKVHKKIFEEIRKIAKQGTTAREVNKLC
jgi:methionine aminopeptidase